MSAPRGLSRLPSDPTLREGVSAGGHPAGEGAFLGSYISPLVKRAELPKGWYLVRCQGVKDGSYSPQIFVRLPGPGTKIHEHSSWRAFWCGVGGLSEERYEHPNRGSRPNRARLRIVGWGVWGSGGDGISTLLPREGSIHQVGNPADGTVSVHLCGPRTGDVDGRDYEPSRDYVCDRGDA
jgi:hypothetical protein